MKEQGDKGIETEMVQLAGKNLHGCRSCMACFSRHDGRCAFDDDELNGHLDKMRSAQGIILACPTYFTDVSAEMKALIDRAGLVSKANDSLLARKVGAALVAVRRVGAIHTFDTMNHFFLINEMVVPGSCYWNTAIGREVGDVERDEEGMRTMDVLGENMAWTMQKLYAKA